MAPRFLLPLAAGGAALAVGVTAALIGVRFATPETLAVPAPTIEVPVLAPVDEATSLAESVAASGDELPVSPTVGTRDVPEPGGVDGDAPDALRDAYFSALEEAADPADVPPPASPTSAHGDPCADGGGDCPDGVGGTVLPLGGDLPALQLLATGERGEGCPAAGDADADAPGAVRFWARTNAPVIVNAYASDGFHRDVTDFRVTAEQESAWTEDYLADGEAWITSCIMLDGFDPDTSLNVFVTATRIGSDEFVRRTVHVSRDDGLSVPPTRIHPVGETTVFIAAPHTPDERVQLSVQLDDEGLGCRYGAAAASTPAIREPRTLEVPAEELAAHAWEPDYTQRTTATFAVPTGHALIACVGWYPASEGESWDADRPIRVSELSLRSPVVAAPVVTVAELQLTSELAEGDLVLGGAMEDGVRCGSWTNAQLVPDTLCDLGDLIGREDVSGAFLLTTEIDTPEGLAVAHQLLDISLHGCAEGCAASTRSFDVPLSTRIRPSRICSGDCTVNRGETVGVVRITATWPEIAAGEAGWVFGEWYEGAHRVARDPSPRMDVTRRFHVEAIDAATRSQRATLALRTDRPTTATVELEPGWDEIPGVCPRPGGSLLWTSTGPSTSHPVVFEGLCLGTTYYATVTLTDETGATSVYSLDRHSTRFWGGGQLVTAGLLSTVVIDQLRLINPDPASAVVLRAAEVTVAGTDARIGLPAHTQRCWVGDVHGISSGTTDIRLGESIWVGVDVRIGDAEAPEGLETPRFPSSSCAEVPGFAATERVRLGAWISYEQYLAGARVTLTDPDTGWVAVVEVSDSL